MQEILAVALQSMHQDMNGLDQVAMNMSNALTAGYKRTVPVSQSFGALVQGPMAGAGPAPGRAGASVAVAAQPTAQVTDASAGSLKSTGRSLDLALDGAGFFEIATPDGPAYTRQGDFRIDARGRLVNADGYPVMGKGGELVLGTADPVIDLTGNVTEAGRGEAAQRTSIGQLKVVSFEDTHRMRHLGKGLLSEGGNPSQPKDDEVRIRQAWLENSNVNSMQEMLQLMQTMRHFESMQRVVQGYDELIGMAVRKLGEA
jgi:flagellar basal-body rod protein FlgG